MYAVFTGVSAFGGGRGQTVQWSLVSYPKIKYIDVVRQDGEEHWFKTIDLVKYAERYEPLNPKRIINIPKGETQKQLHFPAKLMIEDPFLAVS